MGEDRKENQRPVEFFKGAVEARDPVESQEQSRLERACLRSLQAQYSRIE